ncbi:MAG: hypothetical protein IJ049_01985 [Oscillospiraceae bacterium]|nr:hypothetical protein [Oscillospiraceae bacterium]
MRIYHMSDTLQLGDALKLDYKGQFTLAEPFMQALERSEEQFYAMFLNGKYLRAVLGKHQLWEWTDYVRWSVEGAFEYIRRREFPHRCSRLKCNYFFDDLSSSKTLFENDWGSAPEEERMRIRLYEVELQDEQPQVCDMRLYDKAYDAMWDNEDLKTVLDCARNYFSGGRTETPVREFLSDQPAKTVADLTSYIHD